LPSLDRISPTTPGYLLHQRHTDFQKADELRMNGYPLEQLKPIAASLLFLLDGSVRTLVSGSAVFHVTGCNSQLLPLLSKTASNDHQPAFDNSSIFELRFTAELDQSR